MVVLAATKLFIALICVMAYSEAADQSEAGPLVQVNFYGRLELLPDSLPLRPIAGSILMCAICRRSFMPLLCPVLRHSSSQNL